jgi:hypothetical protein
MGRIVSRDGFSAGVAVAGKTTSLHDWITSGFGIVIFYEGVLVRALNKATSVISTLYTLAGRAAVVAEAGNNAFISVFGTDGLGAGQARIYQPSVSATTVDKAFSPPLTALPVITDITAGLVSQGEHKFAYIMETRTGFVGKPSPQPSNIFSPTSFTVSAGGRVLNMAITVTIPADGAFIHPIMTRVENPDRWYFVPDAQVAVTPGATTVNALINISDEMLADGAEEVNDQFGDLFESLSQRVDGTGPFNPSVVFTYGTRMAWIVDNKVYFSDPKDYQYVTEDQHVVQTAGKRRIITGCQLRGSAYLFGTQWTYSVDDNGDLPATWADATEVSGAIGTPAPLGIEWRTAGDYIWVVARSGLYVFNGQYPLRPISYYNAEWDRINWAAAYAIQIRDRYTAQEVYVAVPLDNATEATHTFCWSYARGLTPEDVDFSLDDYNTGSSSGRFGSLGLVQDPTSLENQLWIGPLASGNIRVQDSQETTDAGATVANVWESGFVLGGAGRKKLSRFGGIDVSVVGAGLLDVTIYGPDRLRNTNFPVSMTSAPGEDPEVKFDMTEEDVSARFAAEDFGESMDVSSFVVYHKPYATNR